MPLKSKAQVRKFFALEREGKITKEQLQEALDSTPNIKKLPEHVKKASVGFAYGFEKVSEFSLKSEHKDPEGGLTAKGRAAYNKATGSNLKPGVRGEANTPEKMRRKGSWAVRFYGRKGPLPPLKKPNGEPTRYALSAAAWGEPVPKTEAEARAIATKGQKLLERYRELKKTALDMSAEAARESSVSMTDSVPGAWAREEAETGQRMLKSTRTPGVRNEDREFSKKLKTKYDTARGGRRYGYE
jgi:hypothetical protein